MKKRFSTVLFSCPHVETVKTASGGALYDPFSGAIHEDPYPAYREPLECFPLYRNESHGFWALSRFDDVQAAFRDWRRYSSAGGVTADALLEITGPSFLTMDPPRHDLLRDVVKDMFRPSEIARLEARVVEELLRFESPIQNMARTTSVAVDVHGQTIPAGSRALLLIGAANRDPRVWVDPDRRVLAREPRRHLAFGDGIHHCLGAPLARLEGRVALSSLVERFPEYVVSELERFHDVSQRNLKRLVVELGPLRRVAGA